VTAIAVSPHDDQLLFAGTDGFLFRSDDGGDTWRPVLSFPRGTFIDDTDIDIIIDATDVDLGGSLADLQGQVLDASDLGGAGDLGGLLDVNGGGAFAEAPLMVFDDPSGDGALPDGDLDIADRLIDTVAFSRAGPGVRAIRFVPGSRGVMYAATPRGLYRTTTNGSTFDRIVIPGGGRENDVRDVAVDPRRPSRLYLATGAGLLVSRDGGVTFQRARGAVGAAPALCAVAEITGDAVVVLVGTERGLFRSTDGGQEFLEVLLRGLPPFTAVAAVALARESGTYYAGTADGLFVGERGAALLERYPGVPSLVVQAASPDPFRVRSLAIGTRTRGVLFSTDAGLTVDETAEQVPAGEVFGFARGSKADDLLVATDRGVFRSVPGTGVTQSTSALRKLRQAWSAEPSLAEVAHEALVWSRLESGALRGMRDRAAMARFLPRVLARFVVTSGRTNRTEEFIFRAQDELPPTLDPENDERDLFGNIGAFLVQPSFGDRYVFRVALTWELDRFILTDDEIAAARQGPQWWTAERRVLDNVRALWSARRRLMTEVALGGPARGKNRERAEAQRQLRIEELTALLDAATGGNFSRRLAQSPDVQEDRR
jgi:photosystem II stability/assembly factor-like uncharacterized protein